MKCLTRHSWVSESSLVLLYQRYSFSHLTEEETEARKIGTGKVPPRHRQFSHSVCSPLRMQLHKHKFVKIRADGSTLNLKKEIKTCRVFLFMCICLGGTWVRPRSRGASWLSDPGKGPALGCLTLTQRTTSLQLHSLICKEAPANEHARLGLRQ